MEICSYVICTILNKRIHKNIHKKHQVFAFECISCFYGFFSPKKKIYTICLKIKVEEHSPLALTV